MFVNRMLEPDEELREFMSTDNPDVFIKNVENFRCPGFFNNELGDFVMKTVLLRFENPNSNCSSNESAYCIPFVPTDPVLKEPLYVAFTSCGSWPL